MVIFTFVKNTRNLPFSIPAGGLTRVPWSSRLLFMNDTDLITIEPGKRSGQPCIRGMRITVRDVLEYLAGGMTVPELLDEFPELTADDVRACLAYAAAQLPVPAA